MKKLLKNLNACKEGIDWAGDKTWEEVYTTCYRCDWLLWLYAKTTDLTIESNHRLLTLAKGKCANTVRHLMKDERSIKALDTAIAYGEGKVTREELDVTAYRLTPVYDAAAVSAYSDFDSAEARKANQLLTANIVRNVIPIEKFNIN